MQDHTATMTDWKSEYRTLIREMESSERVWRDSEALLCRAGSQIAIAAMGQSSVLDERLQAIVEVLRGKPDLDALQRALDELSESLRHAPRSVGSTAADLEIALIMRELVLRVGNAPVFRDAARPLAETMQRALANNDWAGLARALADTVTEVTDALNRQKAELESFLGEVTHQLAQFEALADWHRETSASRLADGELLEREVDAQLEAVDINAGTGVDELKRAVRIRLEAVRAGLSRFRDAEAARTAEAEARTAALLTEINLLRRHTRDLAMTLESTEERLMHDALTGVHSRYAYEQRVVEEFHRWQRHGGSLALAVWDIDRFKRINDDFGHSAGDKLLMLIARILSEYKREEDFVARIGGEEFVLLLPATDVEQALKVAGRIRHAIAGTPFHYRGRPERVTISCGVTEFRADDTHETAFERADQALYRAKAEGRDRCVAD